MYIDYVTLWFKGLCQMYIVDFSCLGTLHDKVVSVHFSVDIYRLCDLMFQGLVSNVYRRLQLFRDVTR